MLDPVSLDTRNSASSLKESFSMVTFLSGLASICAPLISNVPRLFVVTTLGDLVSGLFPTCSQRHAAPRIGTTFAAGVSTRPTNSAHSFISRLRLSNRSDLK